MIFRTFDSDIDKWTAKIGIFGKSFHDLGIAINEAFTSAINNIDNLDKNIGFWESLKNNLFNQDDKDFIKNALGEIVSKENIDSYIAELDLSSAKEKLKGIFSWEESGTSWEKYFEGLGEGEKYIKDLIKNTDDLSKLEGQDLVDACNNAREAVIAHNEQLQNMTFSAKAGQAALKGLAIAGNMLAVWAISELISGMVKLAHVSEDVAEKASELGNAFKDTSSDIDSYKTKIEDLYETINDSSSSISDVTEARKNLMSVQDELIEKFGTEKETIDTVTSAINGQSEALDELAQKKWQETENEFNNSGGLAAKISNFFHGYDNNIERMEDEMEDVYVSLSDKATTLTEDLVKSLEHAGYGFAGGYREQDRNDPNFENLIMLHGGTLEKVYDDILKIQKIAKEHNAPASFLNEIAQKATELKEKLDHYEDMWDPHVLNSRILPDKELADSFNAIKEAYEKYQEAFTSGNEEAINKAQDDFAEIVNGAIDKAGNDQSVVEFFENMYPALKSVVNGWEFKVDFEANADGMYDEVQDELDKLKDKDGRQLTAEEILALGKENEQYRNLVAIADKYNMSIEEMIELLKERRMVSAMDYQGLAGLFGQENVDKLSPEDLEIAYTIKNAGSMTFDQLFAEIQRIKEAADPDTPLLSASDIIDQLNTQLKPAFDSLKSAYQDIFTDDGFTLENVDLSMLDSIKSAIDDLNKMEGVDIDIDYSSFENLADVLTDSSSTAEEAHEAMNALAGDIVKGLSPSLTECSGENYKLIQSMLESVGIINSEQVMISSLGYSYEEYIAAKEEAAEASFDLAGKTEDQIEEFVKEQLEADNCGQALALLQLKKLLVNNTVISTVSDVEQILTLANAAAVSSDALIALANAKAQFEQAEAKGDKMGMSLAARGMKEAKEQSRKDILDFEPVKLNFSPNSGSSGGKDKKETEETFDWIEKAVENLEDEISRLDKTVNSAYSSFSEKNQAAMQEIESIQKEIGLYQDAYAAYMEKAESIGLSDGYKELIQNGSVSIEDISDEDLKKAISEYEKWYDKAEETQDKINDLYDKAKDLHVSAYEMEAEELERLRESQTVTEREYLDSMLLLYKKYYDKQTEYANQAKEARLKLLKDEKSYLETVASAAASILDDEIEGLEDDKDKARRKYEKQIESIEKVIEARESEISVIQEQIDALNDENDEIDRQMALQQALYDRQRAYNQKNKLVYKNGQMEYDIDHSAVKEADDEVRAAQKDITVANLQKQIDSIQEGIDALEEQKEKLEELADESDAYFDRKIADLEAYQNEWKRALELEEQALALTNLKSMFGEDAVSQILNRNTGLLDIWKQDYADTMAAIDLINSGTVGSITSEWSKLAGVAADMQNAKELSELSVNAVKESAELLTSALDSLKEASSGITEASHLPDFSSASVQFQTFGGEVSDVGERIGIVTDKLNSLAAETAAYEIPPVNTEQFDASLGIGEGTDGVLSHLNGFVDRFREICSSIPSIWAEVTNSINSGIDENGGRTGYQELFDPMITAMETAGSEIEGKLHEYEGLWTDFNESLASIIGVGGNGEGSPSLQAEGKADKQKISSGNGNKQDISDGSIVGVINTGGEAVAESLNEVWIHGFEDFASGVDSICASVCGMVEDMANDVISMVNAALKAMKELEAKNTGAYKIEKVRGGYSPHPVNALSANAYGTPSSSKGRMGIARDQDSVVNELGNEMLIRDGVLYEIHGGMKRIPLKKGDIILNHKQTEELKKYDRVISGGGRGRLVGSFASGNAGRSVLSELEDRIRSLYADGRLQTLSRRISAKDEAGIRQEVNITINERLRPLQPDDFTNPQLYKAYTMPYEELKAAFGGRIAGMEKQYEDMERTIQTLNNISHVNNGRVQNINVGDIHITCPGVTSKEVMREVGNAMNQQFSGLALAALQESKKR